MDESNSHLREFVFDQMTLCLANAREWPELLEVLRNEESRNVPRATIPIVSLKSKQIESILQYQEFKDLGVQGFYDLSDWNILNTDSNGNGVANDFSYHRLISLTENTICNISLGSKSHKAELERICSEIVQSGLQECLRTFRSHEHLNNLVILNHICNKIAYRNLADAELTNTKSLCVDKSFGSTTLAVLLNWCEYFDNVTEAGEQINLDLRLDLCSMTRKEGNLLHCKRQLEGLFEKIDFAAQIGCPENERSLQHICVRLIENVDQLNMNIWNKNTVRSVCEMSKWLYSHPERKETAIQVASAYTSGICEGLENSQITTDETIINQRMARTFLTLAEWLQSENDQFLSASTEKPLGKLISSLDEVRLRNGSFDYESAGIGSILSPIDLAIGKLLSRSVQQCPEALSKAYGAYGNWCYRWGRKIVELHTEKDEKAGLRSTDLASILDLIPNATSQDIELISNVLDQHKLSAEDEELVVGSSNETSSTELIEMQLRQIDILTECPSQTLLKIIEIWRFANRNIYSFYEMAADAYFKYLHLATMQNDSTINISNKSDDGKSNEDCSIVTATLRILRLIVKHALGLQEVLEEGLESTPTSPWKVREHRLFAYFQRRCKIQIFAFYFSDHHSPTIFSIESPRAICSTACFGAFMPCCSRFTAYNHFPDCGRCSAGN